MHSTILTPIASTLNYSIFSSSFSFFFFSLRVLRSGGVTDEQTGSFIDTVSAMDAGTLKLIIRGMIFLGSLYQPAVQLYNTVDTYTFGSARYIALFLVMIVLYYVSSVLWFVFRHLFAFLYWVYTSVRGQAAAQGGAGAAGETVYQAASAALSSDLTAAAAATTSAAAATAAAATGAVKSAVAGAAATAAVGAAAAHAAKGAAPAAVEADDDKYDF